MKKKTKMIIKCGIAVCLMFLFIIACDFRLKTVTYEITSNKINTETRITFISDLHGERYGTEQNKLLSAIEQTNPDIILLGGDIFDDNADYDNAAFLLHKLSEKYACFYVPGNHEYWSHDIDSILSIVREAGITILQGANCKIEFDNQIINICGVDDPDALLYCSDSVSTVIQLQKLEETTSDEYLSILLSHRPELAEQYRKYSFDLVLCGHAHGGQWRIPGILNGLYAPNQGVLPKYAGGQYTFETNTMIVSRGLSRVTTAVPRIFNRPELVVIELKPEADS